MAYSVFIITILLLLFISKRRPAAAVQGGVIAQPAIAASPNTIRIGAYNIHRAKGIDGRKDLSRIADMLSNCDIAGLSELEGGTPLFRQNQLDSLAQNLKLAGVFACTQMRWGFENRGNGALSRFTINTWSTTPLLDTVGKHPRCLLQMEVQIGNNKIAVFVTHLARRIDQESQLNAVLEKFTQYDKAILIGDLNMLGSFAMLNQALEDRIIVDAHRDVAAVKETEKIDWILVRGVTVVDAGVNYSAASDHPFYWADITIK